MQFRSDGPSFCHFSRIALLRRRPPVPYRLIQPHLLPATAASRANPSQDSSSGLQSRARELSQHVHWFSRPPHVSIPHATFACPRRRLGVRVHTNQCAVLFFHFRKRHFPKRRWAKTMISMVLYYSTTACKSTRIRRDSSVF